MPAQGPPPQEYARLFLIIILLFFLYTSPDQGPSAGFPGSPRDYAAERIERSRDSLQVLNTTQWQDFSPHADNRPRGEAARYLNLTGFREDDGYAWDRLEAFKKRSEAFSEELKKKRRIGTDENNGLEGEVYENVTGIVNGRWVRYTEDLNGEQLPRRLNLSEISPGVDWVFRDEEYWIRNITGSEGKLMIRLEEKEGDEIEDIEEPLEQPEIASGSGGRVRDIAATITIQDDMSSGDGWEMRVHGVHWPRQGVMLMATTSDKFAGIFGLPHLSLNKDYFITSKKSLNKTLERTIERIENSIWIDPSNPWTSSPNAQGDATMPVPHCEFVVYVQVHPVQVSFGLNDEYPDAISLVHQIEQELRFPNGAPLPQVPRLQMSTVMFSPDCGFMLESKGPPTFSPFDGEHLLGRKQEVFLHDVQQWLLVLAACIFGQILLLKIQSKEASTPSTVGRVSLHTIAMMLMADALLFSSLSLLSAIAPNIFPSALLASFAGLMSVALGVRFIGAIYKVQEPERRERLRAEQAAQSANVPPRATPSAPSTTATNTVITAAGADITSQETTNVPSNPQIIIPSDQDVDAEIAQVANAAAAVPLLPTTNPRPTITAATAPQFRPRETSFGAIYFQFILTLTVILFVSLSATSWPVPVRTAYIDIMSMLYLSFWLPQIRRNVIRNCRKALLWKFIVGQSILRLLPFAYFFLKKDNILFAESDWKAFCVLAGWVWIQTWILVAQEVLGPRWGIPKGWTEEGWDYHPILREDNVEAGGLPIGLVQIPASPLLERSQMSEDLGSRKKNDEGLRSVDCAICMQVLEVPVIAAGEDISGTGSAGGVTVRVWRAG
ncbi:RING-type E3 ubiquitin transferase TUL1 [Hyphodiscus hymeniophilus]|uniref:RING-type E3 ubiquitin transferase n=1 Tax=Hyphodiscus hymeniophilus TaxID=353542 RepID=A0A9P6VJ54_9HELO|nr:RING-type E3 ubiquitin transferase TUL1 [Hyphodiscus hymeniophilus]